MAGWKTQPAATIAQPGPGTFALSGNWTAYGIGKLEQRVDTLASSTGAQPVVIDGAGVAALDTAGSCLIQQFLARLRDLGAKPELRGWQPGFLKLLELGGKGIPPPAKPESSFARLDALGRGVVSEAVQVYQGLGFIGDLVLTFGRCLEHPSRLRWRPILYNIQSAGTSALPIVGLLAFLLGVVVAYQGADQLQRYGASIFIVDLVGLSMVREFAPLVTAIIVAGRSGAAYAAQIGAMKTSEEIDAMRTLGISPLEMLTLPKLIALVIAMPLLTVFADATGILGGMVMASSKLGVGFADFTDRLGLAVAPTSYMVGIAKAPVFAAIIAVTGCFQGFRAEGGADGVGRQTTRSVVQSIFLVIVADAMFSILFSMLDL
jgi:phospholipid/cholesterol/gamma-HCH transport system permease protein